MTTLQAREPATADPLQLLISEGDRIVWVHGPEGDRFGTTVREAIKTLTKASMSSGGEEVDAAKRLQDMKALFEKMILALHQRLKAIEKEIVACFVSPHDGVLTAFVVPKSGAFDFALASRLADLSRELGATLDCYWEVLQIPAADRDSLTAFFDPNLAVQVFPAKTI